MEQSWQDVMKVGLMLIVLGAGAPFTQLAKNSLEVIFKRPIEDRPALAVTAVVAAIVAVAELLLSGTVKIEKINSQTFPAYFFMAYATSSFYYSFLKNSDSFLGRGALLKQRDRQ